MTSSITEIRKALADQLNRGLHRDDVEVVWYSLVPESTIGRPRVSIDVVSIDNTAAQGGQPDAVLRVVVDVNGQTEEDLAVSLDGFYTRHDGQSVFEVIEADPTLGGIVDDANPTRVELIGPDRALFDVEVMFL